MKKILICGFCTEDLINNKSYFGGAAGGIALNLASFKIPTGIISVLGKDEFSTRYLNQLKKRKVDTSLITFSPDRLPQLTVIAKANRESSRKFEDFNAKKILSLYKPDEERLNKYDLLHIVNAPKLLSDYLGSTFSGDISYCPGSLFVREPNSFSNTLLAKSSFIFCNGEEYLLLSKRVNITRYFKTKLKMLCITYGEKGVTLITRNAQEHFSATKKLKIIDSTGAGDALVVGFLKELVNNQQFEQGIKEGMRLASLVIGKQGVLL